MGVKISGNDAPLYTEVILVLEQLYKDGRINSSVKKNRLQKIQKVISAMLTKL